TAFTILGGAFAIGIGFGSQNLMNNFISGLILLVERPIRVGDLIQVGDLLGIVERIGARSTLVRKPSNVDIIVPNSTFLESNVINWTLSDDTYRTWVSVGVVYGSPLREVSKLLRKAVDEHGLVLKSPEPTLLFTDFGDDALQFEIHFWIRMRREMDRRRVESDVRFRIDGLFREAGIVIAFPQRDVHLDTARPLQVRVAPAEGDEPEEE
ncbi:MAG: mechanosensitive ion channel family protein, partial [Planctomycetota bacterium JB042]